MAKLCAVQREWQEKGITSPSFPHGAHHHFSFFDLFFLFKLEVTTCSIDFYKSNWIQCLICAACPSFFSECSTLALLHRALHVNTISFSFCYKKIHLGKLLSISRSCHYCIHYFPFTFQLELTKCCRAKKKETQKTLINSSKVFQFIIAQQGLALLAEIYFNVRYHHSLMLRKYMENERDGTEGEGG